MTLSAINSSPDYPPHRVLWDNTGECYELALDFRPKGGVLAHA